MRLVPVSLLIFVLAAPAASACAEPYAGPFLTWAGKAALVASKPAATPSAETTRSSPPPPALPTSLFSPPAKPAAATAPVPPTPVAYNSGGARFYSLHRTFGFEPDAVSTPAQAPVRVAVKP